MIITSRAGLRVELPDEEFTDKQYVLSLAGRIYKAREWMRLLGNRNALNRLMDVVNAARRELGLWERPSAVADDPCRTLVTESDIEWISGIARWCPNWKISAPARWGQMGPRQHQRRDLLWIPKN